MRFYVTIRSGVLSLDPRQTRSPFAFADPQVLAVDDRWPCRLEVVQQRVAPLALPTAGRGS